MFGLQYQNKSECRINENEINEQQSKHTTTPFLHEFAWQAECPLA